MPRTVCLLVAAAALAAGSKSEWENRIAPGMRDNPAFAYVEENPSLPRVLLIGDSISIGYTPEVRKLLDGKANVLRIPVNGGPTSRGIESIDQWLQDGNWDVIHFNWGLHDIKRLRNGKIDINADWQVAPEQYEKNLDTLVRKMKATGAQLIWASTTPVPEGAAGRVKGDELTVNRIAEKIMKKHNVPINDLHACVLPHLEKYQRRQNVHFNDEGSTFLAQKVAEEITKLLPKE